MEGSSWLPLICARIGHLRSGFEMEFRGMVVPGIVSLALEPGSSKQFGFVMGSLDLPSLLTLAIASTPHCIECLFHFDGILAWCCFGSSVVLGACALFLGIFEYSAV